jgi:hypothetical protein
VDFMSLILRKESIITDSIQLMTNNIKPPTHDGVLIKINEMRKDGCSNEEISKKLGISKFKLKVKENCPEFNFIFANRSYMEAKTDFPFLTYDPVKSPYLAIPTEATLKFAKHFIDQDSECLSPSHRTNEIKFLLYDMFITGLEIEDIAQRTGIVTDDIETVF